MENRLLSTHRHRWGAGRELAVHRSDFGAITGLGGYDWEPYLAETGGLVWAFEGVMTVHLGDRRWLLTPQHAAWLPARCPGDVVANVPARAMYIQCAAVGAGEAATRVRLSARAPHLFHELAATADSARALLLWKRLRTELTVVPDRGLHLPLPGDPRAREVALALLDHATDRTRGDHRTMADWADEFYTSPKTLQRLFLRETGMTFPRWRAQARINASLVRLAGGVPVQEVAREVGYASTVGYIDAFRSHFGTTPGAFYTMPPDH